MQDMLRLLILTIVGLFIVWFITMVVDVHMFLHTDTDDIVFGTIPMSRTDIGDRCGAEYLHSNTQVDFKLSTEGEIIYLCPPGFSPIRSKVTAVTLPDSFRKSLTPAQQIKVIAYYPVAAAPQNPVQPVGVPATAAPTTATPPTAPAPMSSTPPPVEKSTTAIPTPAAPADSGSN